MRRLQLVGMRFLMFGVMFVAIGGLLLMGLWNLLMPEIFRLPAISFWQALGLLVLSRVLFGGWAGWGRRMRKARFVRGWADLTPEERERFRRATGPCGRRRFGEAEAPEEV